MPPLAIERVRAYWYPRTGSALLWIRLRAGSPAELATVRALADGDRVAIVEPDLWPRRDQEILVHELMPRLDHLGDFPSIADALRGLADALTGVADAASTRTRTRHSTGNRMIAGYIEDAAAVA